MSFIKVLHTGLHTWYVGARPAPATIRGSTDRRVPPTCRRLPRDFALFPQAIGIHLRLTGSVHQKSRSRPASAYQPSRRHVGGTGFMSKRTIRVPGRLRMATTIHSRDGKSARDFLPVSRTRAKRAGIDEFRSGRDIIKAFGFQTQPLLPRWLAPNSVCQWFSTAR